MSQDTVVEPMFKEIWSIRDQKQVGESTPGRLRLVQLAEASGREPNARAPELGELWARDANHTS